MTPADAFDSTFSVLPSMLKRFDRTERKLAFKATDVAGYKRWRRKLIANLKELTGYDKLQTCPLRPKITEDVEFEHYRRQRVVIQTEPNVLMPFYVLIPNTATRRPLPAIINPHGHASGGKLSPAGVADRPEIASAIAKFNYDYGVQFAKAGFISLCPDARGFGERQEKHVRKSGILNSSCQHLNNMAFPLGLTVTGMWAWDLHRLVDYIQTRRDCDPARIGCAGLSGGGLQTLWATALDEEERIKAAVVSGYFYGYKESLLIQYDNCSCNFVPHLYEHVDIGDIAAAIAPRPLLIETGDRDPLNGASNLRNVKPQVKTVRRAYELLGAGDRLRHDVFPGDHRWNGKQAIPFMQDSLGRHQ